MEPQLCLTNACECKSTHQCPKSHMCPPSPTKCSLKMFQSAHPGYEPRAQLHVKTEKMINRKKEQNVTKRCLVDMSACAQPTMPVLPGMTAEPAGLGPLSGRAQQWRACGASNWVIKTVTAGYRLQFASTPPRFNGILQSQARGEKASVLQEEITSLKDKMAIQIVPPEHNQSGFYSRYFLVPKKGGSLRPILDLRALNRYMRQYSFRMLTHAALIRFVRPGDWFTSIDLTNAYFHIPIYPPHRKYLRFAFQGVTYEYLVLPFGLSLSPRVFVKCTEAAIAPLREKGMRLATYIDDWLLATQSPQEAQAQTSLLISHLMALGFTINVKKSVLIPTQNITYIGLCLNSVTFKARLSAERVEAFQACLALFCRGTMLKFRTCLRLLGLMASALVVVPLGRLHMRPVQR